MIVSYKSPVESNPASAIVKFSFMLLFRGAALCPHPSFHHLTDDSVQTLRGEVRFSEWGPATALIPLLQGASSTSRSCRLQMRNSFKGENVLGVCVCVCLFSSVYLIVRGVCFCVQMYTYAVTSMGWMCTHLPLFERICATVSVYGGVMNAYLSSHAPSLIILSLCKSQNCLTLTLFVIIVIHHSKL